MFYQSLNIQTRGELRFSSVERPFKYSCFSGKDNILYSIACNMGKDTKVLIDEVPYVFKQNAVLPLMGNQAFYFVDPAKVLMWQFNREFYCIVDHDMEVGCVGFLFHGSSGIPFVQLGKENKQKLSRLIETFIDEFETHDNIQTEMLLALLKRLIIFVTRLAKEQYVDSNKVDDAKFYTIRHFDLLVEMYFREQHQVSFYAQKLNKSPKTLSNFFSIYNHKSPQQVIHERILLESKRLLCYTEKTVKEIAYDLGFKDPAYFCHFFKTHLKVSPTEFKESVLSTS